ncbi:hypothetical protein [Halomonas sp. 3H]|nr:hypothetical protein [Halomonas sp. 3H]
MIAFARAAFRAYLSSPYRVFEAGWPGWNGHGAGFDQALQYGGDDMAGDASKGLWVTLVSGFLAIAGIGAKGVADIYLERARLDSQLIIGALGSPSVESRQETLRLLVDARLIASEGTRQGLKQYFEGDAPREPPQVTSFIQSGERVSLTPRNPSNADRTDIDLFVCGSASTSPVAERLVQDVHLTLADSGRYGRITLKVWDGSLYEELSESELKGTATLIYDAGHGEEGELEGLRGLLEPVSALPPLRTVANAGRSTPWLLSLVVCPE